MRVLKKKLWPVSVSIDEITDERMDEIALWLGANMGCFKLRWNMVEHFHTADYYFRNEKDALMFRLRWSEHCTRVHH